MGTINLENNNGERRIQHYSSSHRILLVGEGDFSFAACLARAFGSAANMVATSLDSIEMLLVKYSGAMANLIALEELGCTIVHEVDAHFMSRHHLLNSYSFDRIVFNFPHAGFFLREHCTYQIELHKNVVRGFLRNAYDMLKENGEVHITHKTSYPFSKWKIVEMANEVGLVLLDQVPFSRWDYPGYENKKGAGFQCDETFPVGACSTYKFRKPTYDLLFLSHMLSQMHVIEF